MQQETIEQTAERLKNFPGKIRGEALKNHIEFIKMREGEKGVKEVEEKMKELGVPVDFKKIKSLDWINEGQNSLVVVLTKELFGWSDEDVFEMGRMGTRISFITKVAVQPLLVSIEKIARNVDKYWEKYFDFGTIETAYFNAEERKGVFREKGFYTHPTVSIMHAGYFKGIVELVLRDKKIDVQITASVYQGDEYTEYTVTWN